MRNLKITEKTIFLLIISMLSMVILTVVNSYFTNEIKVTGDLYNRITINKDLSADIHPPTYFIVESYMITYEMIIFTRNFTDQVTRLETHKNEYLEAHKKWMESLDEGNIKTNVSDKAYESALKFYSSVEEKFIPAIQSRDYDGASRTLRNVLTPVYQLHKSYIEAGVEYAKEESLLLEQETHTVLKLNKKVGIGVIVVSFAFVLLMGFLIIGNMAKSMAKLLSGFEITSKGDFTHEVTELNNDELGTIANYLNLLTSNMKGMIGGVKTTSNDLTIVGDDLYKNMEETSTAISQISVNISHIKTQMNNQTDGVQEAKQTVNNISQKIESLNAEIEGQSASVIESSSAIEEMVANISSVNNVLTKNKITVEHLKKAAEAGRDGITEVSNHVQEMSSESDTLLEATTIIERIASQTNLLAMNAAIEAAHAGEMGKGFAVVADEIRKLAEDSNEQVKSISAILTKFQNSISTVSEFTEKTQEQFNGIFELSTLVNQQESVIKSAMDEQNSGGTEILKAMKEISDITDNVKTYSNEILENSHGVMNEMNRLNTITGEVHDKMDEISKGSNMIDDNSNKTMGLTKQNQEKILNLLKEIKSFKID